MITDNDYTQKIQNKWCKIRPELEKLDDHNKNIIPILLENQERYFKMQDKSSLEEILGSDYKNVVYNGIIKAASNTDLWKIVSTQPMTQPVSVIFYLKQAYVNTDLTKSWNVSSDLETSSDVPTVNLSIESEAVAAVVRSFKTDLKKGDHQLKVNAAFGKALGEFRREIFGDMLTSALELGGAGEVNSNLDPLELLRVSNTIHKRTMRGPANRILCHPKYQDALKVMNDRFIIYTDHEFPEDKLLIWFSGASILDQPFIVAPYVFTFLVEGMIQIRYAKKLVNPHYLMALDII